jgi:hypothetical protein
MLVGRHTTSDRQVFQQLNRVRHLNDDLVHVFVDGTDKVDSPWTLQRVQRHMLENVQKYEQNGHHLAVERQPLTSPHGQLLESFLPDKGYNAVCFRNELEDRKATQQMESLLKQRICMAGGRIWCRDTEKSDSTTKKQLQSARRRRLNARAKALASSRDLDVQTEAELIQKQRQDRGTEDEKLEVQKRNLRRLYRVPTHLPLSVRFVKRYGEFQCARFERLLDAARGGSDYLRHVQQSGTIIVNEFPQHMAVPWAVLHHTEQLLLVFGIASLPAFLAGAESRRDIDIQAEASSWIESLPRSLGSEAWHELSKGIAVPTSIRTQPDSRKTMEALVHMTRKMLKHNFSLSLKSTRRQKNKVK